MKRKNNILLWISWAVETTKHLLFWGALWVLLVYAIWQIG